MTFPNPKQEITTIRNTSFWKIEIDLYENKELFIVIKLKIITQLFSITSLNCNNFHPSTDQLNF